MTTDFRAGRAILDMMDAAKALTTARLYGQPPLGADINRALKLLVSAISHLESALEEMRREPRAISAKSTPPRKLAELTTIYVVVADYLQHGLGFDGDFVLSVEDAVDAYADATKDGRDALVLAVDIRGGTCADITSGIRAVLSARIAARDYHEGMEAAE